MTTLAINLRHAARSGECVTIGGGVFGPTELLEAADLIDRMSPSWMPITHQLLDDIDAGLHGWRFWIVSNINPDTPPLIAEYQWQQGSHPHGFNDLFGRRWSSQHISHVAPFVPPTRPK